MPTVQECIAEVAVADDAALRICFHIDMCRCSMLIVLMTVGILIRGDNMSVFILRCHLGSLLCMPSERIGSTV